MSLATRCTACDTVFRVVQDQLKVSAGWVRCGRCNAVFNALEGLFDLEPEPPPPAPPPPPPPPPPQPPPPPPIVEEAVVAVEAAPPEPEAPAFSRPMGLDATPASRVAERDRLDFADARFNNALLAEAGLAVESEQPASEIDDAEPLVAEPAPEFLRRAERQARWARPRTVALLALLAVLLAAGLALQAALHWRDLLAALLPPARPALVALCDLAGCSVDAPRRIDDIVIESSTLTNAPGDAMRLSVVLRNRGPLALAMPSIELTLTDAGGQMLVRRALAPQDFGLAAGATLAAASESTLQLLLSTGNRRATGYTVEPFYP